MTNQDVFGTGFKVVPPGEPEVSEGIGCYRSVTLNSSDGAQTIGLAVLQPVVDPQQAVFNVGFRLTPETGNLVACTLYFIVQTGGVRCALHIAIEDIALNGYTASRIKPGANQTDYATHMSLSGETTGYNIMYSGVNYGSKQIQPGVEYVISGNIVKNDFANSHISINGKKLLNGTHVTESTAGMGYAVTSEQLIIVVTPMEAVPIKFDFFNVYGAAFATPTGTDGTEYTEPLVNYNDWGAPTPDNGRMYYTANPEIWQLNWNSTVDPLGNVGINEGVFTGSSMAFSLADEEMFLHKTPEGMDWIIAIEQPGAYAGGYFQLQFDTALISSTGKHFIVVITESIGTTTNSTHYFTGFGCANSTTSFSSGSFNYMIGNFYSSTHNALATTFSCTTGANSQISSTLGSQYHQKFLQTAWTGNSYLQYFVGNKLSQPIKARSGSSSGSNVKGPKLFIMSAPTSTYWTKHILYYAIYSADLIALHPEITWSDGVAMHNYFYKPDSYEVVDDLVNAIPGIQPTIVCYNARQVRGLGCERHSLNTFQQRITSGYGNVSISCADFYSTDMLVTGKFTASS